MINWGLCFRQSATASRPFQAWMSLYSVFRMDWNSRKLLSQSSATRFRPGGLLGSYDFSMSRIVEKAMNGELFRKKEKEGADHE